MHSSLQLEFLAELRYADFPRSLISFAQQCANVFKSFRPLETDCNIQRDVIECSE